MSYLKQFGARVRSVREQRGMSQKALAERAERSAGTISAIENGKQSVSLITAVRIADGLGVNLSHLLPV